MVGKLTLLRGAWRSRTALAGFADQRLNRSSNAPFGLVNPCGFDFAVAKVVIIVG